LTGFGKKVGGYAGVTQAARQVWEVWPVQWYKLEELHELCKFVAKNEKIY